MKAKIDLEKFICSMLQYAEDNCEETMLDYLRSALQDQDLEYKDGEIVEIPQESEDERIKKEILELVSISGNGNQFEEIKDWLEKQEKLKWSEEDDAHLHSITTHLGQWIERHPNTCGADIQWENLAWLKQIKQKLGGEQ